MSAYYGTLETEKGTATRTGNARIRATAQTFLGSVSVAIENGCVTLSASPGTTKAPARIVWQGTLGELLENQLVTYASELERRTASPATTARPFSDIADARNFPDLALFQLRERQERERENR